ncbi:MAG TPA: hypothetical protein VF228_06610 [Iamia sp.]
MIAETESELAELSARLHNARIELPTELEEPDQGPLRLRGAAQLHDLPLVRERWPFSRPLEADMTLSIDHVRTVSLTDDAQIGVLLVDTLTYDVRSHELRIEGIVPTDLVLTVADLRIRLELEGEPRPSTHIRVLRWRR